jgi:RNA polymerase sigma factor (TIGR02999 family)
VGVTPALPELLERSRAGDETSLNELVSTLYGELHRVASRQLRGERTGHTLQTTALVHEVYLKLAGSRECGFNDKTHFLCVASRVMRHVLVELQPLTTGIQVEARKGVAPIELLDLDRALEGLSREDQSLAQLIEMRYFGGMTAEETAGALGQSVHIVRHDLRLAQAWLSRRLSK